MKTRAAGCTFGNRDGAAAVELALVAPVIAGLAILSFSVWEFGTRRQDMRSALDAGAQYYLNGGSSDLIAQAITVEAWPNKPQVYDVSASRTCRCVATVIACADGCPTGTPPAVYVTLQAHGVQAVALLRPETTLKRVVRVR
ncbi:MAG: hypothetical protein Q8R82_22895 [Hyphomonadaceae bacterium]|nr:hypothetical protein [Hyphomonadaceae bacterium]